MFNCWSLRLVCTAGRPDLQAHVSRVLSFLSTSLSKCSFLRWRRIGVLVSSSHTTLATLHITFTQAVRLLHEGHSHPVQPFPHYGLLNKCSSHAHLSAHPIHTIRNALHT